MTSWFWRAAAATAAVCACAGGFARAQGFEETSVNLHRVRDLFEEDVRAVWLGDSWCLPSSAARLPYGALMVWPIGELVAVQGAFRGVGPTPGRDFTAGPGSLTPVDHGHGWVVEVNDDTGPARHALPVHDMTKVIGDAGLVLDRSWQGVGRVQDHRVRNDLIGRGDLDGFAGPGDRVRARLLYYRPRELEDLAERVRLFDLDGTALGSVPLRGSARGFWHLGDDPDNGFARVPAASQINAVLPDFDLSSEHGNGPGLVVCEDNARPLVGSGQYWGFAGVLYYKAGPLGRPLPGYSHTVLSGNSWQYADYGADGQSDGNKRFTDSQFLHWFDVSTLDRMRAPVFILHLATEQKDEETLRDQTLAIVERFRRLCGVVGTAPARFLLLGAPQHRVGPSYEVEEDRAFVDGVNRALASIAGEEPDCAFVSLFALTDGVFFTDDANGVDGTQQASRDWLDANGWSTITYGGRTHHLSSAENGGLDGVLFHDGLHLGSTPAASFFARLISDEIMGTYCPGDFNRDGTTDSRDVLAFLNAWAAGDSEADYNGDGVVNTIDVLAFLNAWTVGCDG